jgi:predicted nucleotidyltransferase
VNIENISVNREENLMENTGIKPIVLVEIRKLAQQHHVKKVILFGYRTQGDFKRTSDIDDFSDYIGNMTEKNYYLYQTGMEI